MKHIAIIFGKIITFFGKVFHRGSSLPGKIALILDPHLLKKLKYPEIRIAVTGSSGKGSTSSLIANTLKKNGYSICFNDAGSNMAWGITSALLKKMNLKGEIKTDALIIEIDERYSKEVLKYIKPTEIVITNLTKDQPPRQHHVDIVYQDVLASITPGAKIITNMDDPYLRNFEKDTKNENIYYSLAKYQYSYKNQIFENLNTYHCPYCNSYLKYEYYNFETLGNYKCPTCSFKYQEPNILGKNLNLEEGTIIIHNELVNIGGDMLYHAYNTLAAYATLISYLDESKIVSTMNELNKTKINEFKKDKIYHPISCKAENATTYNQAVLKVAQNKELKDIIIGWKEISRRYHHYDISWLYDIEFELLNNNSLNKIYAVGIDAVNIQKRLILAGIPKEKIITAESLIEIKEKIQNSNSNYIFGILNFDYMIPFKETFKEEA